MTRDDIREPGRPQGPAPDMASDGTPNPMATLAIENIAKRYRRDGEPALNGVSLKLTPAIYGLLGRNGAGKSTLLGLIANRLVPTDGAITLDGEDVRDNECAQSRIYLVNETLPFMMGVRITTILKREERYYGGLDWAFATRMLAEFGIMPGVAYGGLSLGQRQIVRLVAALAVPVDVLLLDEPVIGLDAANRELFYRFLLESFADRPRIIVISTHIIDEIAQIIERAIILDRGRIVDEFAAESVGSRATVLVGDAAVVDPYVTGAGLQVIADERMGRIATVTVRGRVDAASLPEGVIASGLGLQDYFIRATSATADKGSRGDGRNAADTTDTGESGGGRHE